jgi:hypothetical protein
MFFRKLTVVFGYIAALAVLVVMIGGCIPNRTTVAIGLACMTLLCISWFLCFLSRIHGRREPFQASADLVVGCVYEIMCVWQSDEGKYYGLLRKLVKIGEKYDPKEHRAMIVDLNGYNLSLGYKKVMVGGGMILRYETYPESFVKKTSCGYKMCIE